MLRGLNQQSRRGTVCTGAVPAAGVFVAGGTLAAVDAVCRDEAARRGGVEVPLLDRLAALVDQSLLQHTSSADGEPRFTMLETLREFALEQ